MIFVIVKILIVQYENTGKLVFIEITIEILGIISERFCTSLDLIISRNFWIFFRAEEISIVGKYTNSKQTQIFQYKIINAWL